MEPMLLPSAPEAIPEFFFNGWNEKNADRLSALFEDDADFVNVTGIWWHTRKQIRKAHDYSFQRFFKHAIGEVLETKVKYLSDTIATVHARWKMSGQLAPDGSIAGDRTGIFLFVAHLTPQGWKCSAAQNTDILDHMETIVTDPQGRAGGANYQQR